MITPLYVNFATMLFSIFIRILMVAFYHFYSGGVERVCEGGV